MSYSFLTLSGNWHASYCRSGKR